MPTRRRALLLPIAPVVLAAGCQSPNETALVTAPVTTATPAAVAAPAGPATVAPVSPTMQVVRPSGAATPAVAVTAPPRPLSAGPLPVGPVTLPPASRPAVTTIKSAPASLDAVAAGRKTSTTRKGVRSYPLGPAVLAAGTRTLPVVVTSVDAKHAADLTAADAASNGSASLADYRAALAHDYPGLGDGDLVSVVHFRAGR